MGKRIKLYLIGLVIVSFFSCKEEKTTKPSVPTTPIEKIITPIFNADSAYQFIQKQVDFGPRVPNTPEHLACANWLNEKLQSYGATTIIQKAVVTAFNGDKLNIQNIIGQFNPDKGSRILLFAHWDTRPVADKDTERPNEPIDGANDGGSGVGVLLEIARQFSLKEPNLGVDIIFFDAEDYGTFEGSMQSINNGTDWCLGSQYWKDNPPILNYQPRFGILLDMVGEKNVTFPKEGVSLYYAAHVVDKVWNTARNLGYSNYFVSTEIGVITDDHVFVNQANIPSIDIIGWNTRTGQFGDYHHTHADNMDVIDKNSLKAVGQTVMEVVYQER